LKLEELVSNFNPLKMGEHENLISDIIYYNLLCVTVVVDVSKGSLWYFKNGRWKESSSGSYLWNVLSSDFQSFLSGEGSPGSSQVDGTKEVMRYIASWMGSVSARNNILRDLQNKLYNKGFLAKLDGRTDVIGMDGNVFDFNIHEIRKALPGDYVSMICRTPTRSRGKVRELEEMLDTIFPDPDIKKFFIRSCASMLEGYNKYKVFYIWKGNGNNAKSLMQRLISVSLGDYYATAPTSLITRKRGQSSSATPELAFLEGKLAVFLQEPNPDEKIQVGQIKELTGNDHMYVRGLYKSPKNIKIKAKFFIVTNRAMDAPNMDSAFRRRLVVVPFESTFLTREEYWERKDKTNCHIVDPDMEERILDYADAFMTMIIEDYKNFKEYGLEIPRCIRRATDEYVVSNNPTLIFTGKFLQMEEDSSETIKKIYSAFKEWSKNTMPSKAVIGMVEFCTELELSGWKIQDDIVIDAYLVF
jgi:P4 family phage/plasmid primase-like protien